MSEFMNRMRKKQAQKQQVKININDAELQKCSVCGCETFEQVFRLRILSKLVSPTGQKQIIKLETFRCFDCGKEKDLTNG